jgi:MarR family transcriptional regulator, organic hydroperoxide resistance regulator
VSKRAATRRSPGTAGIPYDADGPAATSATAASGPEAQPRSVAVDQLARAAYRLSAADARLRGRATREVEALSLGNARALRSLAEMGPLSISQMADAVETTGAAVTQLVNGLARAGFVIRERAMTGDRRTATVTLTEKGRRRHEARNEHLARTLTEQLADFDTAEVSTAAEILRRLAALYDTL